MSIALKVTFILVYKQQKFALTHSKAHISDVHIFNHVEPLFFTASHCYYFHINKFSYTLQDIMLHSEYSHTHQTNNKELKLNLTAIWFFIMRSLCTASRAGVRFGHIYLVMNISIIYSKAIHAIINNGISLYLHIEVVILYVVHHNILSFCLSLLQCIHTNTHPHTMK